MISFKEDHISQIPALQLLQKLGYTYLTPGEVDELRGGSHSRVLLESILRERLKEINEIQVTPTRKEKFSDQNIEAAIEAMRKPPLEKGYISANEYVYNLLTLGKAFEQSIDDNKKSYTIHYIDWKHPERNHFHVAEEYAVTRSGISETYRPDIVLFVNGIPLGILECKRPDLKDSIEQAVSQHWRNQQADGIQGLYLYSHMLVSLAVDRTKYATTNTPAEFWSVWHEQFAHDGEEKEFQSTLHRLVNTPLSKEQKERLFGKRFGYVRHYFDTREKQTILPSGQDKTIYSLLRPERFMDMLFRFTIYENGIKKLARYQQYFVVNETIKRITPLENERRQGGVIWHTQGSGKSLTMVMLAQSIMLSKEIRNPRILLVTDRTDLDRQITATFKKCGTYAENASTGRNLTALLQSKSDAVITTLIHKFETAVKQIKEPLVDPNIFVLVDEGHRTQYGEMSVHMRKVLPQACFIAFTGTPLMKKEKNTINRFGGMIRPIYTVHQAVEDKAVVPLLYEGRLPALKVNDKPLDDYFIKISDPLTDYQREDLKKKQSRADQINQTEDRLYAIAWNISEHFRDNFQGKFKGQLVCPTKRVAVKYKTLFDQIGIVATDVLITAPDTREGEDNTFAKTPPEIITFWKKMIQEHGTAKKYEENLINRFKNNERPEIIIVVDKLLTGFDEPKNSVLYIDRSLTEHTLLQAIARVNRVYPGKDFGYVIDYYGVLDPLNRALDFYAEFDPDDLDGTITDISEQIRGLPQKYSELWDIFKEISNKHDLEAYEEYLRPEDRRQHFYDKLLEFGRHLKVALTSETFHTNPANPVDEYKRDMLMFMRLRSSIQARYSDNVDFKKYEGQIQKLMDRHISVEEIRPVTELVDIFDKQRFAEEVEKQKSDAAKADTIASRTARHINERMEMDESFYKKFSELLNDTIKAYEQGRITAAEYLRRVIEQKEAVLNRTDDTLPVQLLHNEPGRAWYGFIRDYLATEKGMNKLPDLKELSTTITLALDRIIREHIHSDGQPIVEWKTKTNITGPLKIAIEDYLIDHVGSTYGIHLSDDELDHWVEKCIKVATRHFPG